MPIDAEMFYREGGAADLPQLRQLAMESWCRFEAALLPENWPLLWNTIRSEQTYKTLLACSKCVVCETGNGKIVGMSFLVPRGNPTELYLPEWSYIRFLTVHPGFGGRGIGRRLMEDCIALARQHQETAIALHTSEIMNHARRLYENLGFRIIREIEPRFGKRYWLYKLEL